jgi:hypothetical protein
VVLSQWLQANNITSGNLSHACIFITDNLNVDVNFTFNSCNVKVLNNKQINFNKDRHLRVLKQSRFSSLGSNRWNGFVLAAGASIVVQDSEITEANFAIWSQGGSITTYRSKFDRNDISILIDDNSQIIADSPLSPPHISINSTIFSCSSNMKPGTSSNRLVSTTAIWVKNSFGHFIGTPKQFSRNSISHHNYGIRLENSNAITIVGFDMTDINDHNNITFTAGIDLDKSQCEIIDVSVRENTKYGVYALVSAVSTSKSQFSTLDEAILLIGGMTTFVHSLSESSFSSLNKTAIQYTRYHLPAPFPVGSTPTSFFVSNCGPISGYPAISIQNAHFRITIQNNQDIIGGIQLSDVHNQRTLMLSNSIKGNSALGIDFTNCENVYMVNNKIDIPNGAGIRAIRSNNSFYCCNTISNSTTALIFDDADYNTELWNTIFQGNVNPLIVYEKAEMGPQINKGNDFRLDIGGGIDAIYYGTDQNLVKINAFHSQEQIGPDRVAVFPLSSPIKPDDWYRLVGTDILECQTEPSTKGPWCGGFVDPAFFNFDDDMIEPPIEASIFDQFVISEKVISTPIEQQQQWNREQYLFARLNKFEGIRKIDAFEQFYQGALNTNLSSLYDTEQAMHALNGGSLKIDTAELEKLIAEASISKQALMVLYHAYHAAEDYSEPNNIELLIKEQIAQLVHTSRKLQKLDSIECTLRQAELNVWKDINAHIIPEQISQYNQKQVQALLLENIADQVEWKSKMEQIAVQCPEVGGRFVYTARAVAAAWGFESNNTCSEATERKKNDNQLQLNQVFPNPVRLGSKLKISGFGTGTAEFTNILGSQSFITQVSEGIVEVHSIPQGWYFLRVTDGDTGAITISKLLILEK